MSARLIVSQAVFRVATKPKCRGYTCFKEWRNAHSGKLFVAHLSEQEELHNLMFYFGGGQGNHHAKS